MQCNVAVLAIVLGVAEAALDAAELAVWDGCSAFYVANPEKLGCYRAGGVTEVKLMNECSGADATFCADFSCAKHLNSECVAAHTTLILGNLTLHEEDEYRLCDCLSDATSFSIRDVNGFKRCRHRKTKDPPFVYTFDAASNSGQYSHATCVQVQSCLEISLYDSLKHWTEVSKATSCADYLTCKHQEFMGRWVQCAKYADTMTMKGSTGSTCTAAQNKASCEPYRAAVFCSGCADQGALAEPGQQPVTKICAHQLGVSGKEQCEVIPVQAINPAQAKLECDVGDGEYCPHLSETVAQYSHSGGVAYALSADEACRKDEQIKTGQYLCATENPTTGSFTTLTASNSGPQEFCASKNGALCAHVECEASLRCQIAYVSAVATFIDQNKKDTEELCACLGDEYEMVREESSSASLTSELQSGLRDAASNWQFSQLSAAGFSPNLRESGHLYTCVLKGTKTKWDAFTWDLSNLKRAFTTATCDQIARCEPHYAHDRVEFLQTLPTECEDYKSCQESRARMEATFCASETIADKTGSQCSAADTETFCQGELIAHLCGACGNGDGYNRKMRMCSKVTFGRCEGVLSGADCSKYYCPSLWPEETLTTDELCAVCMKTPVTPGKPYCCADTNTNNPFKVATAAECPATTTLCAGLNNVTDTIAPTPAPPTEVPSTSCTPTTNCIPSTTAQVMEEYEKPICSCLGPEFTFEHTSAAVCKNIATSRPYDAVTGPAPTFRLAGERVYFSEMTCTQLTLCATAHLQRFVELQLMYALTATCDADVLCAEKEAAETAEVCRSMVFFDRNLEQCDNATTTRFCAVGLQKVLCSKCTGDEVCAEGTTASSTCSKKSEDECAIANGVFCPTTAEPVWASASDPHVPVLAPSSVATSSKWGLVGIFVVGLGLCVVAFCMIMKRQEGGSAQASGNEEMQSRRYSPPPNDRGFYVPQNDHDGRV